MTIEKEQFLKILHEELKILPDQAPLEYFVHHNNLHHYEDIRFEDAVESVFLQYGKSPYMPLSYYRNRLQTGEISGNLFKKRLAENGFDGLDMVLQEYIQTYLYSFSYAGEVEFLNHEKLIYSKDRKHLIPMDEKAEKLWQALDELDLVKETHYPDYHINRSVSEADKVLIPYLSAMVDQGQSEKGLSNEERKETWVTLNKYLKSTLSSKEYQSYKSKFDTKGEDGAYLINYFKEMSEAAIKKSLGFYLNSLPGWIGMINKLENNKEVIPRKDVYLSVIDYLTMKLILAEVLDEDLKPAFKNLFTDLDLKENLFHYIYYFDEKANLKELAQLFSSLNPLVLRRILQQSSEDTYQNLIISGIKEKKEVKAREPKYQMFFCLDDREESFRRYLEETSEKVETFGVAGFFGLNMAYQKISESRPRRLCPPAATPEFLIKEEGNRFKTKHASWLHFSHSSFLRATIASFILTPFKILDFNFHLFSPSMRRKMIGQLKFSRVNKIDFTSVDGTSEEGLKLSFSNEESAAKVAAILKGAGLVRNFASYIMMIGHGHDSFNNPHVSAYRCGACSGANAFPNAKIFANMANSPAVRAILQDKYSIDIPISTYFIGGYHDTCNDRVDLFNIESNRMSNEDLKEINTILLTAREKNALERCKKFYQVSNKLTPKKALEFVEERSWRIAEPRPELNHATNSLCIVGRRNLTESLFLDRKAFLTSYDSNIDTDGSLLAGLLAAAIPVCAGINLEYYFSKVDTENFGSGSKTSHNVTGLIGVMNGIRGDLRTGLVWQMVEYHDPLRILFIIEATEENLRKVMSNNNQVRSLIENNWLQVALVNPDNYKDIKMYKNGKFVETAETEDLNIPVVQNSEFVKTGLQKPIHIAHINGGING